MARPESGRKVCSTAAIRGVTTITTSVAQQYGVPITSLLRSDDRVLELEVGERPLVDGAANADDEIEAITGAPTRSL